MLVIRKYDKIKSLKKAANHNVIKVRFKKLKKMSFKTMFDFDRVILSLDQTNISINILKSIVSIAAIVFTVT